jgi:hypothetical protein
MPASQQTLAANYILVQFEVWRAQNPPYLLSQHVVGLHELDGKTYGSMHSLVQVARPIRCHDAQVIKSFEFT